MLKFASDKNPESQLSSSIFEIDNILEVEKYVDSDTAIAWDVDDTLYEPVASFFPGDAWFAHQLDQHVKGGDSITEAVTKTLPVYNAAQHKTAVKPCEEEVISLIDRLQGRGIVNFGLTSRGDEVYRATFAQLESLGLNFNKGILKDKAVTINADRFRELKQGVVFCAGGTAKGECLKTVLAQLDWKPKKLVFIDDKRPYLESVQKACEELGIEFIGLRYGFSDEKKKTLNAEVVKIQKEIFLNPILRDEDAVVLLQARKQVKCGLVPNIEQDYALLWSAGNHKATYDKIIALCPEMKKTYRKKAKFYNVDDREILCARFKIPLDKLLELLPNMEQQGLMSAERCQHYAVQIQDAKSIEKAPVRQQTAIVTQFKDYQKREGTEAKTNTEEASTSLKQQSKLK